MPDMDEGAFVLDYNMPVGTSLAQTDKVMRRVEAVLQRTPDISGYIRRTGAELGFFATEPYTGDILVSLKPPGNGARWRRSSTRSARSSRPRSRSWRRNLCRWSRTRSTTWRASPAPSRSRSSAPTSRSSATLAEQVGKIVEEVPGRGRRQHARPSRQSRHRRPARQRPDRPRRPDRAGRRVPAQRRPLRPGGQHGARAGPHDQDSRPLLRTASASTATTWPGCRSAWRPQPPLRGKNPAAAAGIGFVPLGQLATIRTVRSPNELWRENQQPVITVTAELEKPRPGLGQSRAAGEAVGVGIPPRLPLGAGGELPGTAGVVRQPVDWS